MDDILCIYTKNEKWDYEKFIQDFCRSEVYVEPLSLEDGKENTFLETRFNISNTNQIDYWLKNENEIEAKSGDTIISTAMGLLCKEEPR